MNWQMNMLYLIYIICFGKFFVYWFNNQSLFVIDLFVRVQRFFFKEKKILQVNIKVVFLGIEIDIMVMEIKFFENKLVELKKVDVVKYKCNVCLREY